MTRYEALQPITEPPAIPQGGAKRSSRRYSRRAQFGTGTFFDMEAPPPNLRDLTHSARTAVAGEQALPAPAVPDLSRCSSCFPAALYPPLRPPKRTLLDGCPATPDNSLANKTGQVHLLPTHFGGALRSFLGERASTPQGFSPAGSLRIERPSLHNWRR